MDKIILALSVAQRPLHRQPRIVLRNHSPLLLAYHCQDTRPAPMLRGYNHRQCGGESGFLRLASGDMLHQRDGCAFDPQHTRAPRPVEGHSESESRLCSDHYCFAAGWLGPLLDVSLVWR